VSVLPLAFGEREHWGKPMAYGDFNFEKVHRDFGIALRDQAFFETIGDLLPSPWLREALQIGMSMPIITEKARSEFFVAPILVDCRERLQRRVEIFSGAKLDVEPQMGLTGECNFIVARTASRLAIQAPLMMVVEAKKHDIEEAMGQCAAQMLAACRYNERDGKPVPYVYGCVTNVESWLFLKLQGTELQVHPQRFALNEISKILWFFVQCLEDVNQQVSNAA
jgi:hypothetical protein